MSGNKLMIQRGGSLLHSQFCTRSRAVFPQPLLRTQVSSPFTPNWSHSQPQIPASSSAPLPSHGPTVSLLQLKWHKDSLFFFLLLTDQKSESTEWEGKATLSQKQSKRVRVGILASPMTPDCIVKELQSS